MTTKAALLQATKADGDMSVLDMVVDRCPRHRNVGMLMKCQRCSGLVWEHCRAIETAEKRGLLPGRIPRA